MFPERAWEEHLFMNLTREKVVHALTFVSLVAFVVATAGWFTPSLVPLSGFDYVQLMLVFFVPLQVISSLAFIVIFTLGRQIATGRKLRAVLVVVGVLVLAFLLFFVGNIVYFANNQMN